MAGPFISVVIGNRNYGRFLKEALDSVLAQDFPAREFEVLVVDDGSSDESRAVMESFKDKIRPFYLSHEGRNAALNRGVAESRGRVVCFLDSDDVWLPQKLSAVAPHYDDASISGVEHWMRNCDAGLKPVPQNFPRWPERYRLGNALDGRAEFAATSAISFRRDALAKVFPMPLDISFYDDNYISTRALFFGDIANIPKTIGFYRIHGGNTGFATRFNDPAKIAESMRSRAVFMGHLQRWAAEAGKELSPRCRAQEDLDIFRLSLLKESLLGRRGRAWEIWKNGWRRWRRSPFGRFRLASTLPALISPRLYFALYALYSRLSLRSLRAKLFGQDRGAA